jgi:hypothetical protein
MLGEACCIGTGLEITGGGWEFSTWAGLRRWKTIHAKRRAPSTRINDPPIAAPTIVPVPGPL